MLVEVINPKVSVFEKAHDMVAQRVEGAKMRLDIIRRVRTPWKKVFDEYYRIPQENNTHQEDPEQTNSSFLAD